MPITRPDRQSTSRPRPISASAADPGDSARGRTTERRSKHTPSEGGFLRKVTGVGIGLLYLSAGAAARALAPPTLAPPNDTLLRGFGPGGTPHLAPIADHGASRRALSGADSPPLSLQVTKIGRAGISGTATRGTTIRGRNLSKPESTAHAVTDLPKLGVVGADGKFHVAFGGELAGTQEGDYLRLSVMNPGRNTSSMPMDVRARGIGERDTRGAPLRWQLIQLSYDDNDRKVAAANIGRSLRISEPNAQVRFRNLRTGEAHVVVLTQDGSFPVNTLLPGRKGDVFELGVSDGTNNADFSERAATLRVPGAPESPATLEVPALPEPELHDSDRDAQGNPLFQSVWLEGPLFDARGPEPTDTIQGSLGNCYMAAAASSLALHNQAALRAFLTEDPHRKTLTAHFKEWNGASFTTRNVGPLSRRVYVRVDQGLPLYGSDDDRKIRGTEAWSPMFEKAFASRVSGGYNATGNGGLCSEVFSLVLGKAPVAHAISDSGPGADRLFDRVRSALDAKRPVALATYDEALRYTNENIYPNHVYSVLGYRGSNSTGAAFKLRNPWGTDVPRPNEGEGVFWLGARKVAHLFEAFYSVQA